MAGMAALLDDTIYYACGFVFVLHTLTALLVVTHGRCGVYAGTFLITCAMWLDLTVLNLWFFLPTVIQEAQRIQFNLHGSSIIGDVRHIASTLAFSDAAWYSYLMLSGWFVGSMSLSNALTMWQREGCDVMDEHTHEGLAGSVVQWAYRAEEWVGIGDGAHPAFFGEGHFCGLEEA